MFSEKEAVAVKEKSNKIIIDKVSNNINKELDHLISLNILNSESLESIKYIYFTESNNFSEHNLELYKNVIEIIKTYNNISEKSYFYYFNLKDIVEGYISLQENLATKLNRLKPSKIKDLSRFYTDYTSSIIKFFIEIGEGFKKIGIVEERAKDLESKEKDINIYRKLSQSLSPAYRNDITKSSKEIYEDSNVAKIKEKGESIVRDILDIEKLSRLDGEPIIKPTVDTMSICVVLPKLYVNTEEDFKTLIDWLYKIFWENKEKFKKYMQSVEEFEFINNLRRYYYHDLEHGDKKDYKKKYILVNEFFKESCGVKYPSNTKEWQESQQYIYNKLDSIIKKVKDSLTV